MNMAALKILARISPFLALAAIGASAGWWATSNHYEAEISGLKREHAEQRASLAEQWQEAEQRARRAERERQQQAALADQRYQEVEDARDTTEALRRSLDDQSLRLRVLAQRPVSCGGSEQPGAGGVVDDPIEIELPAAVARRILSIGEDANRTAIKLSACQDYVRLVSGG